MVLSLLHYFILIPLDLLLMIFLLSLCFSGVVCISSGVLFDLVLFLFFDSGVVKSSLVHPAVAVAVAVVATMPVAAAAVGRPRLLLLGKVSIYTFPISIAIRCVGIDLT